MKSKRFIGLSIIIMLCFQIFVPHLRITQPVSAIDSGILNPSNDLMTWDISAPFPSPIPTLGPDYIDIQSCDIEEIFDTKFQCSIEVNEGMPSSAPSGKVVYLMWLLDLDKNPETGAPSLEFGIDIGFEKMVYLIWTEYGFFEAAIQNPFGDEKEPLFEYTLGENDFFVNIPFSLINGVDSFDWVALSVETTAPEEGGEPTDFSIVFDIAPNEGHTTFPSSTPPEPILTIENHYCVPSSGIVMGDHYTIFVDIRNDGLVIGDTTIVILESGQVFEYNDNNFDGLEPNYESYLRQQHYSVLPGTTLTNDGSIFEYHHSWEWLSSPNIGVSSTLLEIHKILDFILQSPGGLPPGIPQLIQIVAAGNYALLSNTYTYDISSSIGNEVIEVSVYVPDHKIQSFGLSLFSGLAGSIATKAAFSAGLLTGGTGGAALGLLELGLWGTSKILMISAEDPDLNYEEIVYCDEINLQEVNDMPNGVEKLLASHVLDYLSYVSVMEKSYSKYEGAKVMGDISWAIYHYETAVEYQSNALEQLALIKELLVYLSFKYDFTSTLEEIQIAKDCVTTNGLPEIEVSMAQQLGFSETEIEEMAWIFVNIPDEAYFTDIIDILDVMIYELSQGFSSIPVANINGPYSGYEGSLITIDASSSFDPAGGDLEYRWDLDADGEWDVAYSGNSIISVIYFDDWSEVVLVEVSNGVYNDISAAIMEIENVAPSIDSISSPYDPILIASEIEVSASFMDSGKQDTHIAVWDWGDQSTSDGIVEEDDGSGIVTGIHTYTEVGVYMVTLTVTDDDGDSDISKSQYIVVYNPEDGFVTGGGWIESPVGAYQPDPSLTGKATFGFISKYKKGASEPTGNTEFVFHVADLNFHSNSYDWLVIAGTKAKYKGVGTINGEGEYKFMLTATDGDPKGDPDLFRIKIWTEVDGVESVIYDNKMDVPDDDYDNGTEIGGGNIKVHKPK